MDSPENILSQRPLTQRIVKSVRACFGQVPSMSGLPGDWSTAPNHQMCPDLCVQQQEWAATMKMHALQMSLARPRLSLSAVCGDCDAANYNQIELRELWAQPILAGIPRIDVRWPIRFFNHLYPIQWADRKHSNPQCSIPMAFSNQLPIVFWVLHG